MLEKLEYAAILYRKVAKATTLFYHPKYKLEDMYLLENKIFSLSNTIDYWKNKFEN